MICMDNLDICCKPSLQHLGLLLIVHGLAVVCVFLVQQPLWLELMVVLFATISLFHFGRLSVLRHPLAISRIQANSNHWQITLVNGDTRQVRQSGEVLVWPWLVVAVFRDKAGFYPLVLMPDSLSVFDHRRSRIYFLHYCFRAEFPG